MLRKTIPQLTQARETDFKYPGYGLYFITDNVHPCIQIPLPNHSAPLVHFWNQKIVLCERGARNSQHAEEEKKGSIGRARIESNSPPFFLVFFFSLSFYSIYPLGVSKGGSLPNQYAVRQRARERRKVWLGHVGSM